MLQGNSPCDLFEPIIGMLPAGFDHGPPDREALNRCLARFAPEAASGSGRPIRFVAPPPAGVDYETQIFETGEVPTRADDWHDAFNALAWCVWPRAKAACNALHRAATAAQRAAGRPGRGACRDALTQFDECGVLVVSADAELLRRLADHRWEAAFCERRAAAIERTRYRVFGHGSWDQLRAPFVGLCGKAIYREIDAGWLALPPAPQQAEADRWLAGWLAAQGTALTTRAFAPLPLLGIPGVTPDSESPDYYRDTRQFRPRSGHRAADAVAGAVIVAATERTAG